MIAPHSNGHVALLLTMARRAGLPWDLILGAETAGAYKPEPRVLPAQRWRWCGSGPGDAMMVAAHNADLRAAAALGMRTAFVLRPDRARSRPDERPRAARAPWDVVADDLLDLADQLGA